MQPLISPVDHETRRSSFQRDEESQARPSEDTPLINRFPDNHRIRQRNLVTIITVGFLLSILLAGIVIGIYLLILQNNSENILPPIDDTLQVLEVPQFGESLSLQELTEATRVLVTHTYTRQCDVTAECLQLINEIQMANNKEMAYNFLVSSNGSLFQGLGWKQYMDNPPSTLIVAFIGNFTDVSPPQPQINAFNDFLAKSVRLHFLSSNYTLIGRNTKNIPTKLFDSLSINTVE
ncbi:peptidoglycan-recognition protein SA-like isoform X1 [Colias croceus]|uniref:peptidoglycan-recognition protein SA-like isoform X1 n=1 Tax=Colias crocea TaxID=72248 RepID=UPI001E27C630|nr:peptidoglycan-recognition protein SA-like isoform X1 [Colias croceus]